LARGTPTGFDHCWLRDSRIAHTAATLRASSAFWKALPRSRERSSSCAWTISAVDLTPAGALVTGFQHAQLKIDDQTIDDRRGFIDWFIEVDGRWRIQAAVDLPDAGA